MKYFVNEIQIKTNNMEHLMKLRSHKKREYCFFPPLNSELKKHSYTFKYKKDLMKFLNSNFLNTLDGVVDIHENTLNASYTLRSYSVWYNKREYTTGVKPKIVLKQQTFRGKKYISKTHKISKEDKKYFAFSEKVINLMCNIETEDGIISPEKAKNLYTLFIKRGFKDFEPSEEDLQYINGHISKGIDFYHWSDRCNWLRTKTIIEYFKRENLI
jgi:hypothetical protein